MSDTYRSQGMSSTAATGGNSVAALFRTHEQAQRAVDSLVEEGFSRDRIRMVEGSSSFAGYSDTTTSADEGFWASLRDMFFPDEDRHVYAEGLRRGGYLVSVQTTPETHEQAVDILDDEGTIDLDESESAWRSQGWSGYTGSDYDRTGAGSGTGLGSGSASTRGTSTTAFEGSEATGITGSAAAGAMGTETHRGLTGATGLSDASRSGPASSDAGSRDLASGEREQVIPIAEEQLRVSKRMREGGRVRVRTYVVEEPVSEQVSLREEHVSVERRPVDRALTGEADPFRERTIEVEEKSEQAVVDKEARVREEVVVRKDVDSRSETVSDTVRRTQVDVEDDRGRTASGTGTTGEPPRR
jgi:uncharacterized protein (TIGR02271 family)